MCYFFFPEILLLLRNVDKYGRVEQPIDGYIIRRMRIECWIAKATDTHTHTHAQNMLILTALPKQQWLSESPSILHYTFIACLVHVYPQFLQENNFWLYKLPSIRV